MPGKAAPRTGSVAVVEPTFAHGAALEAPSPMFDSGFEGNGRRALELCDSFKQLVCAAVAANTAARATTKKR